MNGIWITWEIQRRNRGISSALGWRLFEINHFGSRFKRYLYCIPKTIRLILKERPRIIIVQNPSIVLATLIVMLKFIFNYKAIIDAHYSGIYPLEGKSKVLYWIDCWLQRISDVVIITNDNMNSLVRSNGGRPVILPDKLPDIKKVEPYPICGKVNIAYICTFKEDEPYKDVFEAATFLNDDIVIYVTGDYKDIREETTVPDNVKLLGFIPEDTYWSLLSSVDFIMDLTRREDCLLCGAYEAVSLEKPLILSDTRALKSYFYKGCVHVSPTTESILEGVQQAINRNEKLKQEVKELKMELMHTWNSSFCEFKRAIMN